MNGRQGRARRRRGLVKLRRGSFVAHRIRNAAALDDWLVFILIPVDGWLLSVLAKRLAQHLLANDEFLVRGILQVFESV